MTSAFDNRRDSHSLTLANGGTTCTDSRTRWWGGLLLASVFRPGNGYDGAHRIKTTRPRRVVASPGRVTIPVRSQTAQGPTVSGQSVLTDLRDLLEGRRLFERETFGGNGRTC